MKAASQAVPQTEPIADVQSSADTRRIAIDRVGIKDIRHPVRVKDRSEGEQHTIANFNMYVYLPHNFKGTHMSRFVEILNRHEREITVDSFKGMLIEMAERLESEAGHIEMSFPLFVNKKAPVSGVQSLMDYQVTLVGEIKNGEPAQQQDHPGLEGQYPRFAMTDTQAAITIYPGRPDEFQAPGEGQCGDVADVAQIDFMAAEDSRHGMAEKAEGNTL